MNLQNHRFGNINRINPLYIGAAALLVIIFSAFFLSKFPDGPVMKFAHFMSDTGNVLFLAGGYLALIITAIASKRWRNLALTFTVLITVTLFVQIIKRFDLGAIAMRPCGGGEGFPSGHSASAVALAFLLSWRFPKGAVLWYAWAAAIAWSRAEANAHYPFQVAVGATVGFAAAYLLANMFYGQKRKMEKATPLQEPPLAEAGEGL
jgi:membrane-associated phospholipid phosphatase